MLTGLRIHNVLQNRLNCRDFKAIVVDVFERAMTIKDADGITYSIWANTLEDCPHGIILEETTLNSFGFIPGDQVSMVFGNLRIKDQLLHLGKVVSYKIPMTLMKTCAM